MYTIEHFHNNHREDKFETKNLDIMNINSIIIEVMANQNDFMTIKNEKSTIFLDREEILKRIKSSVKHDLDISG